RRWPPRMTMLSMGVGEVLGGRAPTAWRTGYLASLAAQAKGRNFAIGMTFSCFPWPGAHRPHPAPCGDADSHAGRRPVAPPARPWPRRRAKLTKERRAPGAARRRLWSAYP